MKHIIYILLTTMVLGLVSCSDWLDLELSDFWMII